VTIAKQVAGGEQTASAQDAALDLLARHPEGLTVAEIAEQLRLHVTTVRVHLNRLVPKELPVSAANGWGSGGPGAATSRCPAPSPRPPSRTITRC